MRQRSDAAQHDSGFRQRLQYVEAAQERQIEEVTARLNAIQSESPRRHAEIKKALIDSIEEVLSRRLTEQARDMQDYLQLHAASIVAQVSENATAQCDADVATLPFSRTPAAARAA